jgi:hypothetical protein
MDEFVVVHRLALTGSVFFHWISEQAVQEDLVSHERKNNESSSPHPSEDADIEEGYPSSDSKDPKPSLELHLDDDADNETHHPSSDSKDLKPVQLLAVNGNDIDDDDSPRSCFIDYITSLERSADRVQLYRQAQRHGFGNCGENSTATSLDRTVAAFGRDPIIVSRAKQQKAWLTI